ncbi:hypothetical protein ABG79_00561 [Caloramator mitchellensis]|uniref:DUF3006 domain-containing protein n=1 Tax=Caloramator mitchellensis TaxID=908809 RepID=A0A0R3K349_CALMK|nr:DUF3006 domain-containing protein [Caloramator mitchellensis]KRQ87756.1 hypothetical protein ABG79_00561 [Caloramator mitchellensis]
MMGVIDRFEGEFAVIVWDEGEVENVKKELLPEAAREGDVVVFAGDYFIDYCETQKRKEKAKKYLDLWED